jgi:hypothetical protein
MSRDDAFRLTRAARREDDKRRPFQQRARCRRRIADPFEFAGADDETGAQPGNKALCDLLGGSDVNGRGNASGKPKADETDEILWPVRNEENDWFVQSCACGFQIGRQRLSGKFDLGRYERRLAEFARAGLRKAGCRDYEPPETIRSPPSALRKVLTVTSGSVLPGRCPPWGETLAGAGPAYAH